MLSAPAATAAFELPSRPLMISPLVSLLTCLQLYHATGAASQSIKNVQVFLRDLHTKLAVFSFVVVANRFNRHVGVQEYYSSQP